MGSERLMLQAGRTTTINCWPTAKRFDGCTTRGFPATTYRLVELDGVLWRINEGATLANADWQAEHLKSLGYEYFQLDEGYQYARGEYARGNATQFPDGLRFVGHRITGDGLRSGSGLVRSK